MGGLYKALYMMQPLQYFPWAGVYTSRVCLDNPFMKPYPCSAFSALRFYALCPGQGTYRFLGATVIFTLSLVPLVVNLLVSGVKICSFEAHKDTYDDLTSVTYVGQPLNTTR